MSEAAMRFEGGCLCGAVRYVVEGPARMGGLCLCRTCQKVSGGMGNVFMGVDAAAFRFTKGEPLTWCSGGNAPTRSFCGTCGVHLSARSPRAPGGVIVKVGTLDEPGQFSGPQLTVWTSEMQAFHQLPLGAPAFPEFPKPPSSPPASA